MINEGNITRHTQVVTAKEGTNDQNSIDQFSGYDKSPDFTKFSMFRCLRCCPMKSLFFAKKQTYQSHENIHSDVLAMGIFEASKLKDPEQINAYLINKKHDLKSVARLLELGISCENRSLVELVIDKFSGNRLLVEYFSALRNQEGKDIFQQSKESDDPFGLEVWKRIGCQV